MDVTQAENKDATVWTESFQVRTNETDVTGHLAMSHLCNYLQEVASNHAHALGVSKEHLQEEHLTWMLSRLHVQVQRYPGWGQRVVVETWPSGHNGLLASREFLVRTGASDPIARGTSAWLLIDLSRHRPIRMPAFIDDIALPDRPRPIPDPLNKLHSPEHFTDEKVLEVGYDDLDMNQHANNVSYIRWALESVPYAFRTRHHLQSLDVQFRAEAKYGDRIVSRLEQEDLTIRHGIYEYNTGRELAVVLSVWHAM